MGSAPRGAPWVASIASCRTAASSAARKGEPADLRVALDVDQVLGAQQHRQLAEVHLGADDAVVAAQDVAEVGRHRFRWRRWICATERPDRRIRRQAARSAVGGAPADDGDRGVPVRVVDLRGRQAGAMPSIFACRVRTMKSWLAAS